MFRAASLTTAAAGPPGSTKRSGRRNEPNLFSARRVEAGSVVGVDSVLIESQDRSPQGKDGQRALEHHEAHSAVE